MKGLCRKLHVKLALRIHPSIHQPIHHPINQSHPSIHPFIPPSIYILNSLFLSGLFPDSILLHSSQVFQTDCEPRAWQRTDLRIFVECINERTRRCITARKPCSFQNSENNKVLTVRLKSL
jgi:hypothetical protein